MNSPVWTPPLRIASRVAARSSRRRCVELLVAEAARRAPRVQPRAPQRLVGEQVADAGDRALVEQPRLDRHRPAADALAERVARRPRRRPGRRARSPARSPRGRAGACRAARAGRRRRTRARSDPSRRIRRLVDHDPARHAEVQAELRAVVVGLGPEELPAPVGRGQPVPDQRGGDLARARAGGRRRCRESSTATISRPSARSICWRARSASGQLRHATEATIRARDASDHAAPATPFPGPASASSPRRAGLDADEVFLDLEDAVAPNEKDARARARDRGAARRSTSARRRVVVRVNGTDTPHYYRDLIAVVEQAGDRARRDHAAEGPHARRRRDDRQAADPDRARARASRSAGSGSRRRSRTRPGCSPARRSPPPRRGWRR